MAIGNVTPDSFYASSRLGTEEEIVSWARGSLRLGADILDIGGCSTRPGSVPADEEEEWHRVERALSLIRSELPTAQLSLDTYRPEIAKRALEHFGPMMINDISGGCEAMYEVVRFYGVPYVWTLRGRLDWPKEQPQMMELDVVLDPGFGFIRDPQADYACMRQMDTLRAFGKPILVGVSRKSMVYKPLGLTPETCLSATQALQLYALEHGATILRTHDVKETRQITQLFEMVNGK